MNKKDVGNLIKQGRLRKGLLQKDVAKEMHVSPNTVSNWETGEREFTASQLVKLAKFLRIEKELFPVEEQEKPSEDDQFALRDNKIHSLGKEIEALQREICKVKEISQEREAQFSYLEKVKRSEGGLSILLIEDDSDCIQLLRVLIPQTWGEDVKVDDCGGEDGVIKLLTHGLQYDVVYIDMLLGTTVTGIMLLNMIKQLDNLQHIFVVCMSAEPGMIELINALKAKPDGVFQKPITQDKLLHMRSLYTKKLKIV